jgi:excisionase family DNA binding protein
VFDSLMVPVPVLVTTREVAEMLNVTPETVRQWTHEGRLKPVPLPGRFRYRREDIEKLLAGDVA